MSTKVSSINLEPLDQVAQAHFCQIAQDGDRRIYTCRTFGACDQLYRLIKNRAMSDAVEIRHGVGSHYVLCHPTPLTQVED